MEKKSESILKNYMMYIALVIIFIFFTITTNGGFIQARNLSNLINQAGYVAEIGRAHV